MPPKSARSHGRIPVKKDVQCPPKKAATVKPKAKAKQAASKSPWCEWEEVKCLSCDQGTYSMDRDRKEGTEKYLSWYKIARDEHGGGPEGHECGACTNTRLKDFKSYKDRAAIAK